MPANGQAHLLLNSLHYPAEGVTEVDLETRSLLQPMYYIAHGVEIPPEHAASGLVTVTRDQGGQPFDKGYWFHIDEWTRTRKTTFSLLMELARLELIGKGSEPLLTIALGGPLASVHRFRATRRVARQPHASQR